MSRLDRLLHAVHVACRVLPEGVAISVRDNGTVLVSQPIEGADADMDAIAAALCAQPASDWRFYGGAAHRDMVAVVDGVQIRVPVTRRVEVAA